MSQSTIKAIEADNLSKSFHKQVAVDRVNLQVSAGSICAILGPNGAGKTTVVRMLCTLLKIDSGSARIFGHDVQTEPTSVRSLIGLTGQYASVDEDFTATENLMIFSRLLGLSRRAAHIKTTELLEEFSLTDAAHKPLKEFSGGMRRRLDLASSLISQPPLIFLDEPTTGLDPRTRLQMWETIRRLVAEGSTVLLTTQYLDEADRLADQIVVIDHGRVVAEGTADELKKSLGSSTLQLELSDRADLERAGAFLSRSVVGEASIDKVQGFVSIPLEDSSQALDLLVGLREEGVDIEELSVQKPTLDEVFLSITGLEQTEEREHDRGAGTNINQNVPTSAGAKGP